MSRAISQRDTRLRNHLSNLLGTLGRINIVEQDFIAHGWYLDNVLCFCEDYENRMRLIRIENMLMSGGRSEN